MGLLARSLRVLGLVALLLSAAACDSPKEREAKYVAHGKELFDSGDFVKAALEFKNALQINPNGVDAQYFLGLIAEKQNDIQAAAAAFQKAADADPKHFEAHKKAGQYALMAGDVEATKAAAKDLLQIAPGKPDGHNLLAAALLIQGKLADAEKEANAALAIDPNNIDALVILAGRMARDLKFDDAMATVERGLKLQPDSTDLLLVKLKLLFDENKKDDVIATLRHLHQVDPSNPSYIIDLANQLAQAGKTDEAATIFRQSLDANRDSDQLISAYASFLVARTSVDNAIQEIKRLVEETKRAPKYVLLLEQLYLKAGKLDEASALMTDLQTSAQNANDRLQARTEQARITVLKGDKQGGMDGLKTVLDEDPANESALILRAAIMLDDGKFDSAITDARSVLNHNFKSVSALTILSKAYVANGDSDLAVETLRNLVQVSPNDVDARLQLASLLAGKSSDDALQNLDAAIALRPDAPQLKIQKAEYLIGIGKADRAELIGQELLKEPSLAGAGHRILGQAALSRSDFATAVAEFGAAQAQGESFAVTGRMMVTALVKSGKTADAEALLNQRLVSDPKDVPALVLLAAVRAEAKKYDEAEQLLRRAIAAQPDGKEPYQDLVQLFNEQRKYPEAVETAKAAAAQFPDDRGMLLLSGVAHDTANELEDARANYESILAKWPGDPVAANNLAALIADAWPENAELLGKARSLAEKFRNSGNPILLDTLGWVLLRQKNYDDAAIILEKATSLAPDNQQLQYHYGAALLAKGLSAKAKAAFAKAIDGTPDYRGLDDARQQAATIQ